MTQEIANSEVAAENAANNAAMQPVSNPANGAEVPEAPEAEVQASEELSLLQIALSTEDGARKKQCRLFGRHFSSSQKLDVIEDGANKQMAIYEGWNKNLQKLVKQIEAQKAKDYAETVSSNAANMTEETLESTIAILRAKLEQKQKVG
jgi:hypothetical protein